jgi:hypothetical protein
MPGNKTDNIICEKYPNAEIFKLERVKKIKKSRFAAGALIDAFLDLPDPNDVLDVVRNLNKRYYLVHDEGQCYIVKIENDAIHAEEIDSGIVDEQIEYNGYIYVNRGQIK